MSESKLEKKYRLVLESMGVYVTPATYTVSGSTVCITFTPITTTNYINMTYTAKSDDLL